MHVTINHLLCAAVLFTVLTVGNGGPGSNAPKLHPKEVSALMAIPLKLNQSDWDFRVDPCSKNSLSWITPLPATQKIFANNVTCACNNSSFCHIISILASGNIVTGPLPKSYSKLRNLIDFRIYGSSITDKIPQFIGNWINLYRLDMQGTSMEGPFPYAISQLIMMKELRISDLSGSNNTFPSLENMGYLTELRNTTLDLEKRVQI